MKLITLHEHAYTRTKRLNQRTSSFGARERIGLMRVVGWVIRASAADADMRQNTSLSASKRLF